MPIITDHVNNIHQSYVNDLSEEDKKELNEFVGYDYFENRSKKIVVEVITFQQRSESIDYGQFV
jgi:hypothetical protein